MSVTTPGGELAQIEFRRLSTVAWLSISFLFSIQVLFAQDSIQSWQIFFILGLIISASVSLLLHFTRAYEWSYAPLILYLLSAPILLGSTPDRAWMSYGLLTLTTNLYVATIFRQTYAISIMALITVFQIWVVNQDLSSISDLADMRLLNSYFASLWTLGTGIAFIVIRRRYLAASDRIEEEIAKTKDAISGRFRSISLQNRDDFRNLKLHGTILNTLIYAKNNPDFLSNKNSFYETLKNEIRALRLNSNQSNFDLTAMIQDVLNKRTLNRIRVANLEVKGKISDIRVENNLIEIIREMLLNLEKHTTVAEISIDLETNRQGNVSLKISESAHYSISSSNLEVRKKSTLKSQSLNRLLSVIPSQLAISNSSDGFGLVYLITNLENVSPHLDLREIYRLRNKSLIEFAQNLAKATSYFGLLFLPGYFLLGIESNLLIFLTFHTFLVSFSVLKRSNSKSWLSVSTFISLTLPVVISSSVQECREISYLPWLLNLVMMTAFVYATEIRNKYLRWVPIGIVTLELILLPLTYPSECKDIFLGSLPAMPLIIAFVIVLNSLRRRLSKQDQDQISSVFEDESKVRKYEESLESEYAQIISELEEFNENFLHSQNHDVQSRIDNEIQKIRAYLVCSEQFESEIIQGLYQFVIARLRRGIPTRLSILGDFMYQLDSQIRSTQIIEVLNNTLQQIPCEISMAKLNLLTFDLVVDKEYESQLRTLVESNQSTQSQIQLRVNPE